MNYIPEIIEKKWQKFWEEREVFKALSVNQSKIINKSKYYVLDMFPYPSGSGLHVGHLLGYVASDIVARFKRHQGFNVLHPMGYDSFGLPAEQYAIETGQHPKITIENNIKRYRKQFNLMGLSFDWSCEIKTSDEKYYKWTQYFFIKLFNSWYNKNLNKADSIEKLITIFELEGNLNIKAVTSQNDIFSSKDWLSFSEKEKSDILLRYRLIYLDQVEVNWCPKLQTVLANDEVINGRSERGGYKVIRKKMMQWVIRITAYVDRLLLDLNIIDWSSAIKEAQKNWIGKEKGVLLKFVVVKLFDNNINFIINKIQNPDKLISIFIKRPEIIFGITYVVISPNYSLVLDVIHDDYYDQVLEYINKFLKNNDKKHVKNINEITGVFTGSYIIHPFTKELLPIWISSYINNEMISIGVPSVYKKDFMFSKKFNLSIKSIFSQKKEKFLINSYFLNGLNFQEGREKIINVIKKQKLGKIETHYKLHDAVFSRQRYWGEPIPIYFKNNIPTVIPIDSLPLILPRIDKYLPTKTGISPLGNAKYWAWDEINKKIVNKDLINLKNIFPLELNTMPSWAGSSWYFHRYMDANNNIEAFSKIKNDYWKQVDLYLGGSEHAVGHLLYSRFFQKFLYDLGEVSYKEYANKLLNQGLLLSKTVYIHRMKDANIFVSKNLIKNYITFPVRIDISLINEIDNTLNMNKLKNWRNEYKISEFICEDNGYFYVDYKIEKMSKSKYNIVVPDCIVKKFGADTLRMYAMFLGPIEQSKLWDIKGISGVFNFLKKFWKMYHVDNRKLFEEPSKEGLNILNKAIKKITLDIECFSFNTSISTFMIVTNELIRLKCFSRKILEPLCILISPYAPHIAEELWFKFYPDKYIDINYLGISYESYPIYQEKYLTEKRVYKYPIALNGKVRFFLEISLNLEREEIKQIIMNHKITKKYINNIYIKKFIFIPKKIINLVF